MHFLTISYSSGFNCAADSLPWHSLDIASSPPPRLPAWLHVASGRKEQKGREIGEEGGEEGRDTILMEKITTNPRLFPNLCSTYTHGG